MVDLEIVDTAVTNVKNSIDADITWKQNEIKHKNFWYDGTLKMTIAGKTVEYLMEIKHEIRAHQLDNIIMLKTSANHPFLLVSQKLTPEMRIELRKINIPYIEANGNLFIKNEGLFLFVDGQPTIKNTNETTNRAFTKTGLKVIFHLLVQEDLINKPYREIAAICNVALGNINYVFTGLKEMGYLIQLTKDQYKLTNKKALLDRWLIGYVEKLKHALYQGRYSFATDTIQKEWKEIKFKETETYWAGEPAGDLLTNHLRPELYTIFTTELPNDLVRNYKLIPNKNGNINVYKKFWSLPNHNKNVAPPLLVYADLITTTDKRCQETAKIIYEKYIEPNI